MAFFLALILIHYPSPCVIITVLRTLLRISCSVKGFVIYSTPSYLYPSPLLSKALEFVYLSVAIGFEISTFSVHFLWRFALSKSVPSSVRDNDRKFPHFCRLFRHALLCALINGRQLFVNVLMCSIRCFIPSSCQQLSSLCHAITLVSAH